MNRFFIYFTFFILSIQRLYPQFNALNKVKEYPIWVVGHTFSETGKDNFLSLYAENIKVVPKNVQPWLIRILSYSSASFNDKNNFAKLIGFSSFKMALQFADSKNINLSGIDNIESFANCIRIKYVKDKVYFITKVIGTDVLVFKKVKNGRLEFVSQYNSNGIGVNELETEMKLRIKYESSLRARQEDGVVINGLKWASRNVGAPNKFAENTEDFGSHYQFNRNIGWNLFSQHGWDSTSTDSEVWDKENSPCAKGWRIPTKDDFLSLLDKAKVDSEFYVLNGIRGVMFTDKSTKKSVFFPFAGSRDWQKGNFDSYSGYWSNQISDSEKDVYSDYSNSNQLYYYFLITEDVSYLSSWNGNYAFSVRCVSE